MKVIVTGATGNEIFRGATAVIHLAWLLQPSREVALLRGVNIGGTRRVLEAVSRARVASVVVASSVGAYSPGPKDRAVTERWPTEGIPSSLYSRQKVEVERLLDGFEERHASIRVVRMRPALVFKSEAASELRRLFLGRWVPKSMFQPGRLPFVPDLDRLRFQCVHSLDAGRAFALAALSDVRGPINVAADPVLDPTVLSEVLSARKVRVSPHLLRSSVGAAWRMHLTPMDEGWVDLALDSPLMSTEKAQKELGFYPERTATRALLEVMGGIHKDKGMDTAPLQPGSRPH